jgi:DNA-binding response OmpR family regulator
MRLLIVEDDPQLADGLVGALKQSAYQVTLCATGRDALGALADSHFDLVILDLGLPDIDGLDVLRAIRADGIQTPVIILTAREQLGQRVRGLDIGADDYLVKPFALLELEARIRAHLRRAGGGSVQLRFENIEIDSTNRQALVDGTPVELTARELAILEALVRRQGRIAGKDQLFDDIYDTDSDAQTSALEVHISRIRKKFQAIGAPYTIRALRGLGYRLERSGT